MSTILPNEGNQKDIGEEKVKTTFISNDDVLINTLHTALENIFIDQAHALIAKGAFKTKKGTIPDITLGNTFKNSINFYLKKELEGITDSQRAIIQGNTDKISNSIKESQLLQPVYDGSVTQNARRYFNSINSILTPTTEPNYLTGLLDSFFMKPLSKLIEGGLRLLYVPVAYFRDGNKIVANELPKTVLFLNPYDLNIAQKDNLSSELIKDKLAPALLISNFIKNCMYSPVNSQGQITKMPDVLSTTQLKYVQVSDNLNNKVAATTIVEKTNDLAKQQTVAKSETGTLPKESFVGDISGKFTGIINPKSLSHLDNIKSQSNDPAMSAKKLG